MNDNDYHKPKVSRNKHISIDCSNNDLTRNSVNYLPIIKTNREKKEIIPIAITSNKENIFLSFEQNKNNINYNNGGDDLNKNNIKLVNMRHSTYKKNIPINLKEINSNRAYKLLQIEKNFILNKTKRKLKSDKNLNIMLNNE